MHLNEEQERLASSSSRIAVLVARIAELENALHGLVERVERVGGYATPEEQKTLWRAKEALNRESVIYTTESVRPICKECHADTLKQIAQSNADHTASEALRQSRRPLTRSEAIELARCVRADTIARGEHRDITVEEEPAGRAFVTWEWVIRAIMQASEQRGDAAPESLIRELRDGLTEALDGWSSLNSNLGGGCDYEERIAELRILARKGPNGPINRLKTIVDGGYIAPGSAMKRTDPDTVRELWNAEFEPRARTEPPWEQLDSGIRDTVRALWNAGFEPTDSGDVSKAGEMDCAIETAHVFMRCDPDRLVAEAERLAKLVEGWPATGDYAGNAVEASYSPADGVGVLMLFGVTAPEAR